MNWILNVDILPPKSYRKCQINRSSLDCVWSCCPWIYCLSYCVKYKHASQSYDMSKQNVRVHSRTTQALATLKERRFGYRQHQLLRPACFQCFPTGKFSTSISLIAWCLLSNFDFLAHDRSRWYSLLFFTPNVKLWSLSPAFDYRTPQCSNNMLPEWWFRRQCISYTAQGAVAGVSPGSRARKHQFFLFTPTFWSKASFCAVSQTLNDCLVLLVSNSTYRNTFEYNLIIPVNSSNQDRLE